MKKIKSISIDDDIWYLFQKYALDNKTNVSSLIEQFMRETLKEMKREKKE